MIPKFIELHTVSTGLPFWVNSNEISMVTPGTDPDKPQTEIRYGTMIGVVRETPQEIFRAIETAHRYTGGCFAR